MLATLGSKNQETEESHSMVDGKNDSGKLRVGTSMKGRGGGKMKNDMRTWFAKSCLGDCRWCCRCRIAVEWARSRKSKAQREHVF